MIIFLFLISYNQQNQYVSVKDDLIFKNKNELFLKHTIILINRNLKNADKVSRYFKDVLYKDKVFSLKEFIDVQSFHKVKNNYKDRFIEDVYEDSKYQYIFRDHPASSPNILVYKKQITDIL
ncbi:hypothetical protein [Chryseobacterium ginsengisoli]|uniref:hypothetical protein n=1 Tax=Chryseobacterium ginsengisoli TaxID=363853 RepID=UPI0031E92485